MSFAQLASISGLGGPEKVSLAGQGADASTGSCQAEPSELKCNALVKRTVSRGIFNGGAVGQEY